MESRSTMLIAQGVKGGPDLYTELLHLNETVAFTIPREGERCLYYPQGHLEQMNLSTKYEYDNKAAHLNLPSQILCRVLNVGILVDDETSDIQINFTLLPDIETGLTIPDLNPPIELQRQQYHSFLKGLMASHTRTCGVSTANTRHSMNLGILETSSHAIKSDTMFAVHYKQRASPFVIRLNKYLDAMNNNIHGGMRFKMGFQSEDSLEISFFGTIASIENFTPKWPESMWRCLKVQWDEATTIPRPEKVSPWEIQPISPCDVTIDFYPIAFESKRFNPTHVLCSRIVSNSSTSPPALQLWNESSSFLSEFEKDKSILKDSSSFAYVLGNDKHNTSILARFCNWFCCCFK